MADGYFNPRNDAFTLSEVKYSPYASPTGGFERRVRLTLGREGSYIDSLKCIDIQERAKAALEERGLNVKEVKFFDVEATVKLAFPANSIEEMITDDQIDQEVLTDSFYKDLAKAFSGVISREAVKVQHSENLAVAKGVNPEEENHYKGVIENPDTTPEERRQALSLLMGAEPTDGDEKMPQAQTSKKNGSRKNAKKATATKGQGKTKKVKKEMVIGDPPSQDDITRWSGNNIAFTFDVGGEEYVVRRHRGGPRTIWDSENNFLGKTVCKKGSDIGWEGAPTGIMEETLEALCEQDMLEVDGDGNYYWSELTLSDKFPNRKSSKKSSKKSKAPKPKKAKAAEKTPEPEVKAAEEPKNDVAVKVKKSKTAEAAEKPTPKAKKPSPKVNTATGSESLAVVLKARQEARLVNLMEALQAHEGLHSDLSKVGDWDQAKVYQEKIDGLRAEIKREEELLALVSAYL